MNDVVFKEIIGRIKERIKFNNQIKEKSENEKLKRTMLSLLVMCIVIFSSFSFCISNTRISNKGVINEDSSKSIIDELLNIKQEKIDYQKMENNLKTLDYKALTINNTCVYDCSKCEHTKKILKIGKRISTKAICLYVNKSIYYDIKKGTKETEILDLNMYSTYANYKYRKSLNDKFSHGENNGEYRYELHDYGEVLTISSDGYYPIAVFDVLEATLINMDDSSETKISFLDCSTVGGSQILGTDSFQTNKEYLIIENSNIKINGNIINAEYLSEIVKNYYAFEIKTENNVKTIINRHTNEALSHEECYNENINYIKAEIISEEGIITDYLSFEVFYKKLKNA